MFLWNRWDIYDSLKTWSLLCPYGRIFETNLTKKKSARADCKTTCSILNRSHRKASWANGCSVSRWKVFQSLCWRLSFFCEWAKPAVCNFCENPFLTIPLIPPLSYTLVAFTRFSRLSYLRLYFSPRSFSSSSTIMCFFQTEND